MLREVDGSPRITLPGDRAGGAARSAEEEAEPHPLALPCRQPLLTARKNTEQGSCRPGSHLSELVCRCVP